ncbi:hypothetical protein RN001_009148 [Aquatica leii]|uniref:Sodium-coupled monocarboxylate transporter 1 n=1 Tax=Aquatica leii TaxID=1421715 RepID=A0AAN7P4T6_9COLE|nr:hypothetical protein RN001_009148 [Aquatica leii]
MSVLPVATALIASNVSGVGLLAIPADIYMYGAHIFWICLSFPILCALSCYIYLPVFFKLKPNSIYEYFNHRFDNKVKRFASFLYIASVFVYSPVVIFVPALAFSQVTDINVRFITPIICAICICYTALGGLKAVIWTNALNFVVMLVSVLVIIILGISFVGGITTVWQRALLGHRLDIFEFDPTVRDSFWSLFIGSIFHFICLAILNQGAMQKFLAVPTPTQAKKAILIFCLGFITIILLIICIGVTAYGKYWSCDPLTTKQISRFDQLIPLMAVEVAGTVHGIPGMFIAGVFCASLSTLSASLNTIACSIYEDFLVSFVPENMSEIAINRILKSIILLTGLVCIALIFVFENMASAFDFTVAVQAITNGPLLGLFTLGILCPWANAFGSFCGGVIGLFFISWIVIGNQWYKSKGFFGDFAKEVSTSGCTFKFNQTFVNELEEKPFQWFQVGNTETSTTPKQPKKKKVETPEDSSSSESESEVNMELANNDLDISDTENLDLSVGSYVIVKYGEEFFPGNQHAMNVTTSLVTSTFSWMDYTVFSLMLGMSVAIGIYFGFFGPKQNSKDMYLLGGKDMNVIPVATSLVASQISGISLLAIPADVYLYGSNYWWIVATLPVICVVSVMIYLPVFFKLQLTSIYEYFNLRFDKRMRVFASFLYTLTIFVYNPLIIYIPSLAFSQVSGIHVHYITPVVCAICIFYTTIGGLKAVVWTDALQFIGIIISVVAVFVLGVLSAGGMENVWNTSVKGKRLEWDFNWDPTQRDSFWSVIIGGTFNYMPFFTLNQGSMQKYLALPTFAQTKQALLLYAIGYMTLASLTIFTGNIIYANYWNCDPLSSNQIQRSDQLIAHFLMDVAGNIPLIPGIFIAAGLNTISSTIYEDFVSPFLPEDITQKKASNILKFIVVIAGLICIALIFLYEQMGGVFQIFVTLQGIANGPLLALFTLGVLVPFINAKGAFYGGLGGLLFVGWIAVGNQYFKSQGMIKSYAKPVSTKGCNFTFEASPTTVPTGEPFVLYQLSMWYISLVGALPVIVIAIVISLITRHKDDPPVKLELLCPLVHRFVKNDNKDKL